MNSSSQDPEEEANLPASLQFIAVGRALRFFAVAVTLVLSYPNFCMARRINSFGMIFHDMLGNRPLPVLTAFVTEHSFCFLMLALLLPLLALVIGFVANLARCMVALGLIVLTAFIETLLLWNALSGPLTSIIQGMQAS